MPSASKAAAVKICCPAILVLIASLSFNGCGTPGAPQPPSLRLPEPVADLSAARAGSIVTLHWTMPRRTTDRLLIASQIHGPVPTTVCRREQASSPCQPIGEAAFEPGSEAQFQETLPAALTTGSVRPLLYSVELKSKSGPGGRSAGLSNTAVALAGAAPATLTGFAAEVRADGVALLWAANAPEGEVRLHRHLLTPIPKPDSKDAKQPGALGKPSPEVADRDLLVATPTSSSKPGALDSSVRFGATYTYSAQRIAHIKVGDKDLELAGEPTSPIQVAVIDTFPPAVPSVLSAVLVPEEKTIDLSWQPDTEADLAGYIVYRTEGAESAHWTRISGEKPLAEPAYRDTAIQPGHNYRYSVTAIDQTGHESALSTEATESVPNP
jgi:hypothetical protein